MNKKYLEALERLAMPDELHIKECKKLGIGLTEDYDLIKNTFERLEAIDNANSSEAIECLKEIKQDWKWCLNTPSIYQKFETVKQVLLKAQEQEKVLEIIFEKNVDIVMLKRCKTVEEYNFCINFSKDDLPISYEQPLTQEEFDLLKRCCDGNKNRR